MSRNRSPLKVGVCAGCGRTRRIHARGLCHSQCYQRQLRPPRVIVSDEVIVDHLVRIGPRGDSRVKERAEAVDILLDRGRLSYRLIAERVGVTKRTVERRAAVKRRRNEDDRRERYGTDG